MGKVEFWLANIHLLAINNGESKILIGQQTPFSNQ